MKYEVVIIWYTGKRYNFEFDAIEHAKNFIYNIRQTFGYRVLFSGINDLR